MQKDKTENLAECAVLNSHLEKMDHIFMNELSHSYHGVNWISVYLQLHIHIHIIQYVMD